MRIAEIEAEKLQAPAVGVEHLLTAMHQEGSNIGAAMMQSFGLTLEQVRALNFDKGTSV